MAATVIVELPGTSTTEINKKLNELREKIGAVTFGRALTLVIVPDSEALLEESIAAANAASHEHPSRVIVGTTGDADASDARLDAQLRVGGDTGASEIVVLRLSGPLAGHHSSVVVPFLLPDIPVVAWWPDIAPAVPAQDPLGQLAIRRITDATNSTDPLAAIKSKLAGYTPGDTDLAWSRVTYWRALLASAIDQPPHEPITSAVVSGLKIELVRPTETVTLRRPQTGVIATLSRTAKPDALVPLQRRDVPECLAEDLRRLDADTIYFSALEGIDRVEYA